MLQTNKQLFRGKIGSIWVYGYVTTESQGITITVPGCNLSGILGLRSINVFNKIEWHTNLSDKIKDYSVR